MKAVISKVLLLLSFVLIRSNGFCNEIIFSRLSVNDGLRSNFVNCVWQDHKGFIWVGTESGLQRFDGYKFTQVYNETKNHSLPALPVHQILGGNDHRMWLRLNKTVGWYDLKTNTFHRANTSLLPDNFYNLWMGHNGQVMLTVAGDMVYSYNSENNTFEPWKALASMPGNWGVLSVFEDVQTGRYWISGKKGLGVYDTQTKQFYHEGFNPRNIPLLKAGLSAFILHVFIDNKRRYWIVKWAPPLPQTIYCFDERSEKISVAGSESAGYNEVLNTSQYNNMLMVSGTGVFNIYDENVKRFRFVHESSISGTEVKFNYVMQVFQDADRNIWLATDNGLYSLQSTGNAIRHGKIPKGNAPIEFARQTSEGRLLVGTWGRGIYSYWPDKAADLKTDSTFTDGVYKGLPRNTEGIYKSLWDVAENSVTHHLYFTCQEGGILEYDPLKRKSRFINDSLIFKHSTIRTAAEDHQHNIWFGTQSGKLFRNSADGHFKLIADLKSIILKIMTDSHGMLWICTNGSGLTVFDPVKEKAVKQYLVTKKKASSLSSNHPRVIAQINDSLFAIAGLEGGLDILNVKNSRIRKFDIYNGLPQPVVISLQMDRKGKLWMSTNSGISRFDPANDTFRSYDQKDGLITTTSEDNELNKSSLLNNGNLVFAGGNTFIVFDPSALDETDIPKDVTITDLKLFNENLNVDAVESAGGLLLDHDKNSVTIQFASLSYSQRDKLIYYYKLKGAGDEWVRAEGSLTASYASLRPGHYTFLVKCISPEGWPSKHISSLNIVIRPAFWQTWWFLMLMIIAGAIPFYIIYKLRINRLLAVQKLREKVARDLHDDMGSTLTSIGILSEMANTKMQGENTVSKDYLTRISSNSTEMMDAMDDIVWSINPANDTIPKIIGRMREYAATILEPRDIDYTVINDDKLKNIKLDMDMRRNLFLIYKEALNNLVKYSGATVVKIEFVVNNSSLQLIITDNGIGFDQQTVIYGNGLTNMRKRAENMNGSLTVVSEKNRGVVVRLQLPVT
jgi:ligand-binding sensor domain-containing protein/two-component sensor histidine kinase